MVRLEEAETRLALAEADHHGELETVTLEYERALTALDNMADGILMVDRDLRVERANAAALRLLGPRADGHVGRSLAEVVRDHELVGVLTTALERGAPHTDVIRLAAAPAAVIPTASVDDGGARFIRATGIPLSGRGDAFGGHPPALLVLQDVTDARRAEAMRREFVGNVSHELRTPLASLKALVETLEEGALEDPPAAREFLSQMNVEVDSLSQLIHELLELTRIESGQATLRPEPISPKDVLEDAERRLRRQAERVGVKLDVDAKKSLPKVLADPALIERVLLNLLHNAIKFTPRGGKVTLSARRDADGVCISLADTGIGIPPAEIGRIFERFYKADRSRSSLGTGLGLAIAKHIVQAHGGQLSAESAGEGQGSTFSFVLPEAPAPTAPPAGR